MNNAFIKQVLIYVIVAYLIYKFAISPIFQKLGIEKTSEEIKGEKENKTLASSLGSPFSPSYFTKVKGATLLTKKTAENLAEIINNAIGFFSDDENAIFGVFRNLTHKTQVSWIAKVMFDKYQIDLFKLLERNLSDSDLQTVKDIVKNLK